MTLTHIYQHGMLRWTILTITFNIPSDDCVVDSMNDYGRVYRWKAKAVLRLSSLIGSLLFANALRSLYALCVSNIVIWFVSLSSGAGNSTSLWKSALAQEVINTVITIAYRYFKCENDTWNPLQSSFLKLHLSEIKHALSEVLNSWNTFLLRLASQHSCAHWAESRKQWAGPQYFIQDCMQDLRWHWSDCAFAQSDQCRLWALYGYPRIQSVFRRIVESLISLRWVFIGRTSCRKWYGCPGSNLLLDLRNAHDQILLRRYLHFFKVAHYFSFFISILRCVINPEFYVYVVKSIAFKRSKYDSITIFGIVVSSYKVWSVCLFLFPHWCLMINATFLFLGKLQKMSSVCRLLNY